MLKKIRSCLLTCAVFFAFSLISVIAAEQPRGPINPTVVNVNKTVTAKLMANGCYADAFFTIKGTYVRDAYGTSASEIKLTTTYTSHNPPDWAFVFDGAQYSSTGGGGVKVLIRYHFNTSYIDCPISGG